MFGVVKTETQSWWGRLLPKHLFSRLSLLFHRSSRAIINSRCRRKPRYILGSYLALCFVFIVAAMNTSGTTSIAMLILVLCFESACFATIFTLGLRGLGRHTKLGGSLLVAAISGGSKSHKSSAVEAFLLLG